MEHGCVPGIINAPKQVDEKVLEKLAPTKVDEKLKIAGQNENWNKLWKSRDANKGLEFNYNKNHSAVKLRFTQAIQEVWNAQQMLPATEQDGWTQTPESTALDAIGAMLIYFDINFNKGNHKMEGCGPSQKNPATIRYRCKKHKDCLNIMVYLTQENPREWYLRVIDSKTFSSEYEKRRPYKTRRSQKNSIEAPSATRTSSNPTAAFASTEGSSSPLHSSRTPSPIDRSGHGEELSTATDVSSSPPPSGFTLSPSSLSDSKRSSIETQSEFPILFLLCWRKSADRSKTHADRAQRNRLSSFFVVLHLPEGLMTHPSSQTRTIFASIRSSLVIVNSKRSLVMVAWPLKDSQTWSHSYCTLETLPDFWRMGDRDAVSLDDFRWPDVDTQNLMVNNAQTHGMVLPARPPIGSTPVVHVTREVARGKPLSHSMCNHVHCSPLVASRRTHADLCQLWEVQPDPRKYSASGRVMKADKLERNFAFADGAPLRVRGWGTFRKLLSEEGSWLVRVEVLAPVAGASDSASAATTATGSGVDTASAIPGGGGAVNPLVVLLSAVVGTTLLGVGSTIGAVAELANAEDGVDDDDDGNDEDDDDDNDDPGRPDVEGIVVRDSLETRKEPPCSKRNLNEVEQNLNT
eukprot:g80433.t1